MGALREDGVVVRLQRAWDAGVEDLLDCDALLLGAAENSGSLAGSMKDFLDRTYYPAQTRRLNLTKLGMSDVVVLEQGRLTSGTTWHSV